LRHAVSPAPPEKIAPRPADPRAPEVDIRGGGGGDEGARLSGVAADGMSLAGRRKIRE
jgi:hypothetical protein